MQFDALVENLLESVVVEKKHKKKKKKGKKLSGKIYYKQPKIKLTYEDQNTPLTKSGAPELAVQQLGRYYEAKNPGFKWSHWNMAWDHAESFDADDYKVWYLVDQQSRSGPEYVSEILGYEHMGQMFSKEQIEAEGFKSYDEQDLTEELYPPDDDATPNKYYRDF